jgi:hypothetical protein
MYIFYVCRSLKAVSWLRTLVAGHSSYWPGVNLGPVHVRFVTDKVALGQVSFQVLRFPPITIISRILHLNGTVVRKTSRRRNF